jgi:hypothetical protein
MFEISNEITSLVIESITEDLCVQHMKITIIYN